MENENHKRKLKVNIIKILSIVFLSFLIMGFFIGINNSKKLSIISNIRSKKIFAGEIVAPQTWGGCKWKIESNGKLFIYASSATNGYAAGEMEDIADTQSAPWYQYREKIKTVQVGQSAEYNATPVKVKTNCKIGGMFRDCTNLTSVNFVNIDFSNATTMWYMFYNCKSLNTITGFEKIKATKAKNFKYMFYNCSSLQTLTIGSDINSTEVTDMCGMFHGCTKLSKINGFNNLKTSKVTDMSYMFYSCSSLENITFGTNFSTSNVTNMGYMFCKSGKLYTLDISNFDTRKVTDFQKMLYGAETRVLNMKGENFVSTKATNLQQMFPSTLREISIGNFDFKMNKLNYYPYPWGRGSWEKGTWNNENWEAEGIYSAVERAISSSTTNISGTYKKVSNVADLFNINETITYSIDKYIDLNNTSCYVNGNIDAGLYIINHENDHPSTSRMLLYVNNIPLTSTQYTFGKSDYIIIKIPDAVTDANSNRYDLQIKLSNLYINGLNTYTDDSGNTQKKASIIPLRFSPTKLDTNNTLYKANGYLEEPLQAVSSSDIKNYEVRWNINMSIRNKDGSTVEGNFMFSAYDLDIRDKVVSNGSTSYTYDSDFSEGINLLSGFNSNKIYTTQESLGRTWVHQEPLGSNGVRLRGMNEDVGSEMSEFMVTADASGFEFQWTAGQACGTTMLSTYQPKLVKVRKVDDTGTDVSGALLSLSGNGANEYWTSNSTEEAFFLNPGQHVLHEIQQPSYGYELAEDIIFWVDSENKLTSQNPNAVQNNDTIVMTDQRKNCDYTIEYYYDNVKDDNKTETGRALYQSSIDSYPDKNKTGYKFDKHENFPLTIGTDSAENVIKVYYVKDSFDYSIEYYYDNVKDDDKTETGSALYQSTIDSYPDKNKIGYKFDKHENLPLTIGANPSDNVIKVYYEKDSFDYSIEYYYDNVKDDDKTEMETAIYQSSIDSYPDKNIMGYKFDKHENFPLTISENAANNVIKVYYVKDNYNYTIEYYYDNVKNNDKTETRSALYQSTVDSYPDKNITGYKFDKHENFPLTISENAANNVIKVYYVKDSFNYTVEYYYDNVKDDSKTETNSAIYQSFIDSYIDKNIPGYKFEKTENFPLTITENAANNVIKVYYIIDDGNTKTLTYTVEYYKDNEKVNRDTITRSITVQTLEPDTLEIDRSLIENNNKYVGYKLERTDPTNVPNLVNNGDVIKVYYVKDNFNYTVEYYYDNVKDNNKTETGSALYQSIVDSYPDKNIPGYKFDKHENIPLTIGTNSANNVIKVYYVKDNFNYTIEYYYDNVKDNTKTETGSALYQSTVDSYPDKNITGYKFDKHENFPLTISENAANNVIKVYYVLDDGNTKTLSYTVEYYKDNEKVEGDTETRTRTAQILEPDTLDLDRSLINDENKYVGYKLEKTIPASVPDVVNDGDVIEVYYVKDSFNYTVEYYYDNVKDNSKTETNSAIYQSRVENYTDKNKIGYKFDKHENVPLTITENSSDNIIKVYYIKDNFNYTIEYYYDNEIDTAMTEINSAEYQSSIDDYTDKNIVGYKFEKNENVPLTITENADNNVIKVYYVKDNFNYTVEYYYDNVKDNSKTEAGSALYQSTIDSYTDKNITGYKFDKHENFPLTISENAANNVIKVYYVKDIYNYTIEYYYDNVKDDTKTETGSALYQSTIDSYLDKNITGYKWDKHENVPLTITENADNNVIKVYYVKDNFNYTVEYYYDNVKDNSKTETGSALYQSMINNYTDKNIPGYKFDKHENVPLTITENPDNNIIKVYYVKASFEYSIEYYYDNERDDSKTETRLAEYQGSIDDYPDKNIVGYKFEKHENVPLTITENSGNNVIKVYYVKDSFNYTTEYYYNNEKDDTKTESGSAEYQSTIENYTDKKKDGYEFDKTENLPLTISENLSNNIIKVYYYPIRKLTVNHIDMNTNEILETSKEEGREGKAITTSALDFTGYMLVKKPEVENYTLKPEAQIVNYYYAKISSGVVEKHINIVTDKYIADDVSYEGYVGKEYLTSSKNIDNYDLVTNEKYYRIMAQKDESLLSNNGVTTVEELIEKLQINAEDTYIPENYKGKMTDEPIEVKYYYVKKAKVNVHYLDKNSKKPVHPEDTITGHEKDPYATTPIEIEGYDLVTKTNYYPTNLDGEMGEEPIEIIFYYERKAEVEVNHICILDDSKINSYKIEGHEKDSYKTQILDKDEYKNYKIITNKEYYEYATKKDKSILTKNSVTSVDALLEKLGLIATNPYIPENHSGEMTTDKIVVNYYYKKIGTIVVKYIDSETGEIISSTLDVLNYGETYSSGPIDILDYIIDEERMPTNYTGIVEKDSEEIIFYYKKVKQDNTIAPGKIPQTGENGIKIALSLLGIASIVIISKRKIQKYKLSK